MALLLKSAISTPSNTGSLRSFQTGTERGINVLWYWKVRQRWGTNECLWATKAPRVIRAGPYGKDNASLSGRIGLLLILNSMHNTATDRDNSVQQYKVWIGSWAPHCWAILQDRQDNSKRSQEWLIMKYLPGLSHDNKRRSCSYGNRAKVLLKCHLSIKRHPQYNKVSRLFQDSFFQSQWGWLGWIVCDLVTILLVVVLLAFNFIPHKSHHILTLFRSRFRDSVRATLHLGMAQQLPKWSRQHICKACFTPCMKKCSAVYRKNNLAIKRPLCGTPDITLTSLLPQLPQVCSHNISH